eukprot:16260756-Heterocapsa_arctica.AAC.1
MDGRDRRRLDEVPREGVAQLRQWDVLSSSSTLVLAELPGRSRTSGSSDGCDDVRHERQAQHRQP